MIDCPYKCGNICLWASKLANNLPAETCDTRCNMCMRETKESKRRKGHKYRRNKTVEILAAKTYASATGKNPVDVFNYFREYDNSWKRVHMNEYIGNATKETFMLLTCVGLYESHIQQPNKEWNSEELNSEFLHEKDYLTYKNILDFNSSRGFFQSLDSHLKKNNSTLGEHLFAASYPVWVEPLHEQNPNPQSDKCIITIVAGEKYVRIFNKIKAGYEEYAKKVGADLVILGDYTQGWWGLEKFRIKPFVEAYERTCFLDSDIIIKNNAPNIFDMVPDGQIGIHDDWPYIIHKPFNFLQWRDAERNILVKSQVADENFDYAIHDTLFNTGVVLTSKCHADIWTPMKKPFPGNHCDEQFWVEYLILKKGYEVCKLPFSMNCQYWTDVFHRVAGLKEYYFLHLATDATKDEKETVLEEVLEKYAN